MDGGETSLMNGGDGQLESFTVIQNEDGMISSTLSNEEALQHIPLLLQENKALKEALRRNNADIQKSLNSSVTISKTNEALRNKLSEANDILNALREEKDKLLQRIEELSREKTPITDVAEDLEDSITDKLRLQINHLESRLQDLETENCLLCNKKANADDKVTELTEQLGSVQEKLMTVSRMEQERVDSSTQSARCEVVHQEVALQSFDSKLENELKAEQQKVETYKAALQESKRQTEILENEKKELRQTVEQTMSDLESFVKIKEEAIKDKINLEEKNRSTEETLTKLQQQYDQLRLEKDELQALNCSLELKNADHNLGSMEYSLVRDYQEAKRADDKQMVKTEQEVQKTGDSRGAEAVSDIVAEVRIEREQVKKLSEKIDKLQAQNANLQDTLGKRYADLDEKEGQMKKLLAEKQEMESHISRLQIQLTSVSKLSEERVASAERETEQLKKYMYEKDHELTQLRRELSQMQHQKVQENEIEAYRVQLREYQQRLTLTEQAKEQLEKICEEQEGKLKQLNRQKTQENYEFIERTKALEYEREQVGEMAQRYRQSYEEIDVQYTQLMEDYHTGLSKLESAQAGQEVAEAYAKEVKRLKDENETLTELAKVVHGKDDTIAKLQGDVHRLTADNNGLVERERQFKDEKMALETQAQIFKEDFDREREARERMNYEKEELKEKVQALENQIQQQETQASARNIDEMQQRPEYSLNPELMRYPGPPPSHARNDQVGQSQGHQCPCCDAVFQDIQVLQVHVMECIDRSA